MPNPQIQSLTVNGTTYDIVDNTSGYMAGMTILSYGSSTWQDFINAYSGNKVVYCRASSQANPATGDQTRLAFMAYVNNSSSPTSVEFQYYRSVSTHTESQQGDQVFVYTLTSAGSWSVTTREASVKVAVGGDLTGSYSNGTYTVSGDIPTVPTNVSAFTNDAGYTTNTGTITGITMNGSSKGTSGVVDLGTVITTHQTIPVTDVTVGGTSVVSSGTAIIPEEVFIAEYEVTTFQELVDAYEAGKTLFCRDTSVPDTEYILPLAFYDTQSAGYEYMQFSGFQDSSSSLNIIINADDIWSTESSSYSSATNWKNGGGSYSVRMEASSATGSNSVAQNRGTTAQRKSQTALGEFNIADTSGTTTTRGDYAVIVGNGTSTSNRSNALTVDWNGEVDLDLQEITDLTDTTWVFNEVINPTESFSDLEFQVFSGGTTLTYTGLQGQSGTMLNYMGSSIDTVYFYQGSGAAIDGWYYQYYKIITITGGTDAISSAAISWLKENAICVSTGDGAIETKLNALGWGDVL